ncbi:hypothetical protein BaRGS_00012141 [Batillaria attramentaria]|uniref:Uncharacterized protein n=1 Tax=Batillaria attramentaria TaxID=370345 RepID=A0ABD0LAR0_9CAEN
MEARLLRSSTSTAVKEAAACTGKAGRYLCQACITSVIPKYRCPQLQTQHSASTRKLPADGELKQLPTLACASHLQILSCDKKLQRKQHPDWHPLFTPTPLPAD